MYELVIARGEQETEHRDVGMHRHLSGNREAGSRTMNTELRPATYILTVKGAGRPALVVWPPKPFMWQDLGHVSRKPAKTPAIRVDCG